MPDTHDRTLAHYGTEDTSTAILADDIGRYPAGMGLQDVLEDMARRLTFIEETGCDTLLYSFTAQASIVTPLAFSADAIITVPVHSFSADASLFRAISSSFSGAAWLVDHVGGHTVLDGAVGPSDLTITVTTTSTFPFTTPFVIKVDNEQMQVTGGGGTTTWTVTRAYGGTTAAAHDDGTPVNEVC